MPDRVEKSHRGWIKNGEHHTDDANNTIERDLRFRAEGAPSQAPHCGR